MTTQDKYDAVQALNYFDPDENSNKMYLVFRDTQSDTGLTLYTRIDKVAPSIQFVIGLVQQGADLPRSIKVDLHSNMTQKVFDRIVRNKTRTRSGKSTYTIVPLATTADTQVVQQQGTMVPAVVMHPTVKSFIDLTHQLANSKIAQHFVGSVAALSVSQIEIARTIVTRLKPIIDLVTDIDPQQNTAFITNYHLNQAEKDALKYGVTQYYKTIPTALPRKIDPLKLIEDFTLLARQGEIEDRIRQLETALASINMTPGQQVTRYGGLDATILPCVQGDPEYDAIVRHIRKTMPRHGIRQIFLVKIPDERKRWDVETLGKDNIQNMFHSSNNANILSILKSGIIIPTYASNGSRFGRGIYNADAAYRSYPYGGRMSHHDPIMMFLTSVAMGRSWKSSGKDSSFTAAPIGYESVWGTGTWSGRGDEFIVYRLGQCTIRAIALLD